jgi:hypothetical protein
VTLEYHGFREIYRMIFERDYIVLNGGVESSSLVFSELIKSLVLT